MSAPYRYEIWVKGCTVCKDGMITATNDREEAAELKSIARGSLDRDCGGKVVIVDLGEQK